LLIFDLGGTAASAAQMFDVAIADFLIWVAQPPRLCKCSMWSESARRDAARRVSDPRQLLVGVIRVYRKSPITNHQSPNRVDGVILSEGGPSRFRFPRSPSRAAFARDGVGEAGETRAKDLGSRKSLIHQLLSPL
jgi:hypothetical protein